MRKRVRKSENGNNKEDQKIRPLKKRTRRDHGRSTLHERP